MQCAVGQLFQHAQIWQRKPSVANCMSHPVLSPALALAAWFGICTIRRIGFHASLTLTFFAAVVVLSMLELAKTVTFFTLSFKDDAPAATA